MVLSTQNPIDLDYRAISNAGTWMIGRLQTQQDKDRLIDGLKSAAGGTDVATIEATISALAKREFLLHTSGGAPDATFTTRWAMSYLRGPLMLDEIARLSPPVDAVAPIPSTPTPDTQAPADDAVALMPTVAEGIPVRWLDPATAWAGAVGVSAATPGPTPHRAGIAVRCSLVYDHTPTKTRITDECEAVFTDLDDSVTPDSATVVDTDDRDLREQPPEGCTYTLPSVALDRLTWFPTLERSVKDWLVTNHATEIVVNRELKLSSRPDETAGGLDEEQRVAVWRRIGARGHLRRSKSCPIDLLGREPGSQWTEPYVTCRRSCR